MSASTIKNRNIFVRALIFGVKVWAVLVVINLMYVAGIMLLSM